MDDASEYPRAIHFESEEISEIARQESHGVKRLLSKFSRTSSQSSDCERPCKYQKRATQTLLHPGESRGPARKARTVPTSSTKQRTPPRPEVRLERIQISAGPSSQQDKKEDREKERLRHMQAQEDYADTLALQSPYWELRYRLDKLLRSNYGRVEELAAMEEGLGTFCGFEEGSVDAGLVEIHPHLYQALEYLERCMIKHMSALSRSEALDVLRSARRRIAKAEQVTLEIVRISESLRVILLEAIKAATDEGGVSRSEAIKLLRKDAGALRSKLYPLATELRVVTRSMKDEVVQGKRRLRANAAETTCKPMKATWTERMLIHIILVW